MARHPKSAPTKARASGWRDRIVRHGHEAPDQLLANPLNWRIHPLTQQEALADVLDRVGFVQSVIVNQRTGHVVDGHLRVQLAISRRERRVPVAYVDLSQEEERLILATIDPLVGMAVTDDAQLARLLEDVQADGVIGSLIEEMGEDIAARELRDPDDTRRELGQRVGLVRALLQVSDIEVVERAIAATGEVNRGAALVAVCRAYVDGRDAAR